MTLSRTRAKREYDKFSEVGGKPAIDVKLVESVVSALLGKVKLTDGTTDVEVDATTKALKVFLANVLKKDEDEVTTYKGDGVINSVASTEEPVTSSTSEVFAADADVLTRLFINDSDTVIYLRKGEDAVLNKGIRVNANGGNYEMSKEIGNLYLGAIDAIHGGAGNKNLLIEEGKLV